MTSAYAVNGGAPTPYVRMDRQVIGGEWRERGFDRWNVDRDRLGPT